MNCPKCQLLEMRVEKVENNVYYFKCKQCGEEIAKKTEELEKESE